jgi:hypothetical protein
LHFGQVNSSVVGTVLPFEGEALSVTGTVASSVSEQKKRPAQLPAFSNQFWRDQ